MYQFDLITCGSIYADERFHFYGQAPGRMIDSPSYYALVRRNGENLLIDSGFDPVDWVAAHIGMECKAEKSVEELLAEKGLTPGDIHKVVFTHLHWDHIGSIEKFSNAAFYCQAVELQCAIASPEGGIGYNADLAEKLRSLAHRFQTIEGEAELFPGLWCIPTGGHSIGSQAVVVQTPYGKIAMPGDNIARYRNLEENIPAGLVVNLQHAADSVQIIRESCDIVLPSHDWETARRFAALMAH